MDPLDDIPFHVNSLEDPTWHIRRQVGALFVGFYYTTTSAQSRETLFYRESLWNISVAIDQ